MVSVLILTHGGMADEILAASQMISGELDDFEALSLAWSDGPDEARSKVAAILSRIDRGEGVLILTDIFGGTPSNVAMSLYEPGHIEVVSGVNLPMVVRLGCLKNRGMSVRETAEWIRTKGRDSIRWSRDIPAACRPVRLPDCPEDEP